MIFTIIASLLGVALVLILSIVAFGCWASRQPNVRDNYFNNVINYMPFEKKYTIKGNYSVSYSEYKSTDNAIKKFEIWYPSELSMNSDKNRKYPLVIMANGTGVKASKYKAVFDHLASWGFIVLGNEDERSGTGDSSAASLDYILSLNYSEGNQFYQKIDIYNIGIAGHSQGGIGAINAITAHKNGDIYRALYTASAPSYGISTEILKVSYDLSNLNTPYFMTAGTLHFDAGVDENTGISPLSSMEEKYNSISDKVPKVIARRVNTDHGDMLSDADGYMTAWFMYWLQDDLDAKKIFFGPKAEILSNQNWVNIKKNI